MFSLAKRCLSWQVRFCTAGSVPSLSRTQAEFLRVLVLHPIERLSDLELRNLFAGMALRNSAARDTR